MKKIEHNELEWRDNAPVSTHFGDVYYSAENGLAETEFVFIRGIGGPQVWQETHHYVIGETGFGTGLNFLATWKAFRESGARGRLTFISVEGYPLTEEALKAAHETFPDVAAYAAELRAAWPPAAPGFHTRCFDGGQVTLLLLFGEAVTALRRLRAKVDAWYLDGFAPAKNPAMWSDDMLDEIARLSEPGTRFATFTAAGFVRRGLAERGFEVTKAPGYGRKRERLVGTALTPAPRKQHKDTIPEWATLPVASDGPIAVIGGGIAGASAAHALCQRGRDVTLITAPSAPQASSVPAAILAPRFLLDTQPVAEFFTSAFAFAATFQPFQAAWADVPGINILPRNEKDMQRMAAIATHLGWSADWLEPSSRGFILKRGGSLDTARALHTLRAGLPARDATVTALERTGAGWLIKSDNDRIMEAAHVVLACGINSSALLPHHSCPTLRPNRGQVELICAKAMDMPDQSLAYGGYLISEIGGIRTLGSTFDRLDTVEPDSDQPQAAARARILKAFREVTGKEITEEMLVSSWAGIRATTPDHLPYAGPAYDGTAARARYAPLGLDANTRDLGPTPVEEGLSILNGLGSKGFQYGPILGDYLAASLCGDPLPLATDHIALLHPLRRLIKDIIKGQSSSDN
ncbi:tRNA (5-methylaminomethyl-2-thiouridine)(34)-methyltransferase MnmD [Kordiimonas sp.]|uniref:tRNA (5-methylaminomethyl-2-thiouridine)(34)-methyltransferase MnmD n=1 Tax=Kordiimonas sp. TaxID=1970157 RepID=UPI003A8EE86C